MVSCVVCLSVGTICKDSLVIRLGFQWGSDVVITGWYNVHAGGEGGREGGKKGGREGEREGGREREREGGREKGREGGREG